MTSEELSVKLNISKKTVYRVIKEINDSISNKNLIISEKGRGYKLDYEQYILQNERSSFKKSDFSPDERRERITEELLLSAPNPKNVSELHREYYVGESVIFNDEQIISEKLKKYDLKLVRKNRTVSIEGKESDIRRAIIEGIQTLKLINMDELRHNDNVHFNHYDVLCILDQLKLMEKRLKITIPYPYDINIFSHLYILISRLRRVGLKLLSDREEEVKTKDNNFSDQDLSLYEVAETTIENIEKYLNLQLPDSEIRYLYQYLVSSRMGDSKTISTFSNKVTMITQFYLDEMSQRLNIKVQSDSIFLDLANHIKPMMNRLTHGIKINNSLLNQIKVTYEMIHQEVSKVSKMVSQRFNLPNINEDENGFLTLYFARMIETNHIPIRTIIMCTTGVGTSELLRVKIAKKFPELDILDVIASRDVKDVSYEYPGIELILTTIHLNESLTTKSLLVSAMFTEDDQIRLQKKIKEIYNER